MGRNKKTVLYPYKDRRGDEKVGFISSKKARLVERQKEAATKRARRKGITPPEKENEEK